MIRNNVKKNADHKALAAHIAGMYILTEEHEKEVANASTVDEIFFILPKYWSFIDFGNLEDIAETFCSHECEAKKELDDYKGDVQQFCERRVSEFPPGSLNSSTDSEGMDKLVVTLDLQDPSLRHVRGLKEVIANVLGQPASKLVLYDIGIGSIVVTFLIVTSLGEKLFLETTGAAKSLTQKQEDQLLDAKVVSLEFKGITVSSIHQQPKKGNTIVIAINKSVRTLCLLYIQTDTYNNFRSAGVRIVITINYANKSSSGAGRYWESTLLPICLVTDRPKLQQHRVLHIKLC